MIAQVVWRNETLARFFLRPFSTEAEKLTTSFSAFFVPMNESFYCKEKKLALNMPPQSFSKEKLTMETLIVFS